MERGRRLFHFLQFFEILDPENVHEKMTKNGQKEHQSEQNREARRSEAKPSFEIDAKIGAILNKFYIKLDKNATKIW